MKSAIKNVENYIHQVIARFENLNISLTTWLVCFFSIVFLRALLEVFSTRVNYFDPKFYPFLFFHYPAFFLVFSLFVILLLYFLTKEKIEKITKLALIAFFIILLPPIIDLIATGGRGGIIMCYLGLPEPLGFLELFQTFLRSIVYGPTSGILFYGQESPLFITTFLEINFGLRIEGVIVLLGILWYVFLKTKNILKVFLGLFAIRFIGFIFAIFPAAGMYKFSSSLNPFFAKHFVIFSLYFILICILASLWFYIFNKEKCLALFKNLRLTRIIQNIAMLGFGLYLAKVPIFRPFSLNFSDWLLIVMAVISLLLYWLSGIGYDDLSDEKIDRISNPSRPLPQGKFTREEFKALNNIIRIASYICAFVVGYVFFIFLILRSLVAYLYFASPFRLKRFPIIATFTLALATLFTIFGGFLLKSPNSIFDFPGKLIIFTLFAFTFGFMTKDIKDYQGDKANKIYTIPAIFGLEEGKKIIGCLALAIFLLCPLFFFEYFKILILPSIIAGILSFWLINRKRYSEKPLFLIYFSYGLFFVLTVF